MQRTSTKDLATLGLLTGLITVSTMFIKVPVPATGGMIHLGDSMIFLASILFGRKKGAVAAGIGSSLANILAGYSQWALATLIIKALMGYIIGSLADQKTENLINIRNIAAVLVGTIWMVGGYYIAGGLMVGFNVALIGIPWDIVQGIGGAIIFFPIGMALKKSSYFKNYILN